MTGDFDLVRFEELPARVRLRLRPTDRAPEVTVLRAGDLTAREFALLELFLRHPGQVLTREQMLSHVWGYDVDPGSSVVDVYVRAAPQDRQRPDHHRPRMGYRLGP